MIYIVLGVSGCGKSSVGELLAQRFSLPFFDADDFHSPANIQKMASGTPLTDEDRAPWLQELAVKLAHEEATKGAVLACSSLKQAYRDILKSQLKGKAVFVYLRGSFETILARMQSREGHFMNPDLLKSQFDTLEEPTDAIVVDIELPLNDMIDVIAAQSTGASQA